MHMHNGENGHHHEHFSSDGSKTKALLGYMLEHNREHAHELHELAHQLTHEGSAEAASLIDESVKYFDLGNDKLEQAVRMLKGEK